MIIRRWMLKALILYKSFFIFIIKYFELSDFAGVDAVFGSGKLGFNSILPVLTSGISKICSVGTLGGKKSFCFIA